MFNEVVASGLWLAPGDSEEVAAALSQALRNRIERFFIFSPYPFKVKLVLVISRHFNLLNIAEHLMSFIT